MHSLSCKPYWHFGLFMILLLVAQTYAHTGSDIINDDTLDSTWTWHSSFSAMKKFRWHFETWQYGATYREGNIRVQLLQDLYRINIFSLALHNPDLELEDVIDQFFDIQYDEEIAYFASVYRILYFFVPIDLSFKNSTSYHIFEDHIQRDTLFYPLINDTIDNTCIQGCHTEENNPFSTNTVNSGFSGNFLVIDGTFIVNEGIYTSIYTYQGGRFEARYHKDSGLLEHWKWVSEDNQEKVEIIRKIALQPISLAIVGTAVLTILMVVIFKISKNYFRIYNND